MFVVAARSRDLLAIPIAQRDPRSVPLFIRKLDSDCTRLFGLRFEDLATIDVDAPIPTVTIVCECVMQMLGDREALQTDPHLQLALGRHLTLLGAPARARPLFRAFERLDGTRTGIARGWYILATLLAGDGDEAARLIHQTRDAGDFQYADGEPYLDIYEASLTLFDRDHAIAIRDFVRAGEYRGCTLLGSALERGISGTPDVEGARTMYRRACEHGITDACSHAQ